MKCHRPVVWNRINDIFHTSMNCRLRRPYMRTDHRNILWNVFKNRSHNLRILLVGSIIGQTTEALIIHRFPYQLVKKRIFRHAGTQGIELILCINYLGTACLSVRIQIHPIRGKSHRMRRRCHRHRNAVMSKSHTDVSDNNSIFLIKR